MRHSAALILKPTQNLNMAFLFGKELSQDRTIFSLQAQLYTESIIQSCHCVSCGRYTFQLSICDERWKFAVRLGATVGNGQVLHQLWSGLLGSS